MDGANDNKISILTNIRPPKNSQNSAVRPTLTAPPPPLAHSQRYIPGGPMINGPRRLRRLCEKLQSSPILSYARTCACVRARRHKRALLCARTRCIVRTRRYRGPRYALACVRAWAVDFSKHIITESQLHDASARVMELFVENGVKHYYRSNARRNM